LDSAMSDSEPRPSRFRSLSISLASVVGLIALVVAGATIWLVLTDPVTVAEAVDRGEFEPLVEELANVIYNAIVGLIKYL
jgi:flagellar basal body-associated protein FliL